MRRLEKKPSNHGGNEPDYDQVGPSRCSLALQGLAITSLDEAPYAGALILGVLAVLLPNVSVIEKVTH